MSKLAEKTKEVGLFKTYNKLIINAGIVMKNLKFIIRSVVVHSSVFALISFPISTNVVAQDGFDKAAQAGIGIIQNVGGQLIQAKQQQMAISQQAGMMQGMQIQLRPARYFSSMPSSTSAISYSRKCL